MHCSRDGALEDGKVHCWRDGALVDGKVHCWRDGPLNSILRVRGVIKKFALAKK